MLDLGLIPGEIKMSKEKLTEGQKLRKLQEIETTEIYYINRRKMNEPRPTKVDLAKAIEDFLLHELDVDTRVIGLMKL